MVSDSAHQVIHLWRINLREAALDTGKVVAQWLAPGERVRAFQYKTPLLQRRFIAVRSALRWILSQYIDRQPSDVPLGYTMNGKPYLVAGPDASAIEFNVSHSRDWALIALSDKPLGVDIEQLRPELPVFNLARRFFAVGEYDQLRQSVDPITDFYRFWTTKEAVLKAQGLGIGRYLGQLCLSLSHGEMIVAHKPLSLRDWSISNWCAGGYCCAVAFWALSASWRTFDLNWQDLL